ncbi:helix-turn-helix domain-containing protein [Novispirillum itersonii]|uniref:HTH cro/C1-type domain-containing protein n=1 Tax=Novispirillum itersonii TaxID=189 RepID=A0A7W9ZF45_NOVIT|nr:helix-turn-helix transcriptional regulator [Novispirillum itersonii]MBB6210336.1 hypothetical protein [Novispirillum itersonii]
MTNDELKAWRKAMKMTQKQAAEALGVSCPTYQQYESGRRFGTHAPQAVPHAVALACLALSGPGGTAARGTGSSPADAGDTAAGGPGRVADRQAVLGDNAIAAARQATADADAILAAARLTAEEAAGILATTPHEIRRAVTQPRHNDPGLALLLRIWRRLCVDDQEILLRGEHLQDRAE